MKTLCLLLFATVLCFSCNNDEVFIAKKVKKISEPQAINKTGFNPLKHGFSCDSFAVDYKHTKGLVSKFYISLGSQAVDTINVSAKKMHIDSDKDILIKDFNFDGFCDFVVNDIVSASHGGMNYYYFRYDNELMKYVEVKTLPKFIGDFKLDIKNQRVKIYCPYQDCFAYYKFQKDKTFKLVKGKFEVNP